MTAVIDPDVDLIRRARGRLAPDLAASKALVERVEPVIRSTVRGMAPRGLGAIEPDDLVQLVWERLSADRWRRLMNFDPNRGPLESYVRMTTRSLLAEQARLRRTFIPHVSLDEQGSGLPPELRDPERDAEARQLGRRLRAHLEAKLAPRQWLVFVFKYDDELDNSDIAERLGVTPQRIYDATYAIRTEARLFLASLDRPAPR